MSRSHAKSRSVGSQLFVGSVALSVIPLFSRRCGNAALECPHETACPDRAFSDVETADSHHRLWLSHRLARLRAALLLRLFPHADVAGEWLGARRVRACLRAAKSPLGHRPALRR